MTKGVILFSVFFSITITGTVYNEKKLHWPQFHVMTLLLFDVMFQTDVEIIVFLAIMLHKAPASFGLGKLPQHFLNTYHHRT
jgi:hypothetical protein